jgi:hypothetical protein
MQSGDRSADREVVARRLGVMGELAVVEPLGDGFEPAVAELREWSVGRLGGTVLP